jgi:hypothetical protein
VRPSLATALVLLVLAVPAHLTATDAGRPELWFPVGEELAYRVKWGIIPVGQTSITSEWIECDDGPLISIRYRTRTNALFDHIYPMNDYAVSVIDPVTFLPKSFTFVRVKRRGARSDTVTFNHENKTARLVRHRQGKRETIPIQPDTRDIISFMYWLRKKGVPTGLDKTYHVMTNEGMVPIHIRSDAKTKRIKIPDFGKVECLHVAPAADFKDMLVEEGRISMWIARDPRRIAPLLTIKAPLAKVRTTLTSVLGPGDDQWTRTSRENDNDKNPPKPEQPAKP